jgi:thiol-disulfide isomerase/thioredoxin
MKYLMLFALTFQFMQSNEVVVKVESFSNFSERVIEKPNEDTIYFINLWATWCRPCVAELPYIEATNGKTIDGKPVKTIMVSLDQVELLESRVIPFLKDRKYTSEQVLLKDGSTNSWIDQFDTAFSGAIPATLILKNGKRKFHEGMYRSAKQIEKEINKL